MGTETGERARAQPKGGDQDGDDRGDELVDGDAAARAVHRRCGRLHEGKIARKRGSPITSRAKPWGGLPFSHHLLLPSERRDPDTTLDAQGKQADATMQEIQQKYQTF